MENNSRFDFCPRCGAMARDGVCGNCGYRIPEIISKIPKQKKNKGSVVLGVVIAIVVAAIVALILGGVMLAQRHWDERGKEAWQGFFNQVIESVKESQESRTFLGEKKAADKLTYEVNDRDVTRENLMESGQDENIPFYSGPYHALRDDLSYEMGIMEGSFYSTEDNSVQILVEYPQIVSGDLPHQDDINTMMEAEYDYMVDFWESVVSNYIGETQGEYFYSKVDAYVTYMDEKILSVVFKEYMEMKIEDRAGGFLQYTCLNFDLESGTLMQNGDVLRLDREFAVDFREREVMENGAGALTDFSDEEILNMLKTPASLVLFYTPMGMEVGLNLSDRVVYVMYEDYEDYLNNF